MEYEKIVWSVGDEVTAEKLNHMGRGIANANPGDKIFAPLQMVTIDGSTGPDGAEVTDFDSDSMNDCSEAHYGDLSGLIVAVMSEDHPDGVQFIWNNEHSYFQFSDPDTDVTYEATYWSIDDEDPTFRLTVRNDRGVAIPGEYGIVVATPVPQTLPIIDPSDNGKSLSVDEDGKWVATSRPRGLYQVHTIVEPHAGLAESFNEIKAAVDVGKAVFFVRYVIYDENSGYDGYEASEGMFMLGRLAYNTNTGIYTAEFSGVGNYSSYQFSAYDPDDPMLELSYDDDSVMED